jgi:hypothetical protein
MRCSVVHRGVALVLLEDGVAAEGHRREHRHEDRGANDRLDLQRLEHAHLDA